ncbi:MAG: XdhC family protein [Ardenticatenales bacterium]|nr:XdhC family protein [Ardenticatenales bacterium]
MSTALLSLLLDTLARGEAVARVVVMEGAERALWALVRASDAPGWDALGASDAVLNEARQALLNRRSVTLQQEGRAYWIEVLGSPPTLLIVGAGHIAVPLAILCALCEFRVVVVDDRPQYANRARFPDAAEIIVDEFTTTMRRFPFNADTYVVLVTRGHTHDIDCLVEVLDRPHGYIGMIGSKRRVQAVWKLLEQERAIVPERLGRVFAPIGLDVGAETPAEIAVAIMAEITLVRRSGTGQPLSDALRERGARVHQARIQQRK